MPGAIESSGLREAERVESCPRCGAANPDPDQGVLCPACGAVMPQRLRRLLTISLASLAAAGGLLLLGLLATVAALAEMGPAAALTTAAIGLDVLGALVLVGAGWATWRVIRTVTGRDGAVAEKFLGKADRVAMVALAALVAWGGLLSYFVFTAADRNRSKIEAAFTGQIEHFQTLVADPTVPIDPKRVGHPRIKHKAVVLDRGQGLSEAHFELPRDLRAAAPEEVGTVVWLDWEERLRGRYDRTGAPAYIWDCQLTLIDAATTDVIARNKFKGGEPPASAPGRDAVYGPRPIQNIVAWLAALPRE